MENKFVLTAIGLGVPVLLTLLLLVAALWKLTYALVRPWRPAMDRVSARNLRIWQNLIFPPLAIGFLILILFGGFFFHKNYVPPEDAELDSGIPPNAK